MDYNKVIIYGLGGAFERCLKDIYPLFQIVGVSDKNSALSDKYYNFINAEELLKKKEDILVCSDLYYKEICCDLLNYNIPAERIILWQDVKARKHANSISYPISFSQFSEDMFVASILRNMGVQFCNVKYMDIGVNNPIYGSNTYFFHIRGAKGILVEANIDWIPTIKVVRKGQDVINKAVSDKEGVVDFFVSDRETVSSLNKSHIDKCGNEIKKVNRIETIRINELLNQQNETDFLSIDIEGYDEIVLRDIDYSKYHPKVICAEIGNPTDDLLYFMKNNGYSSYMNNLINTIFY